MKNPKDEGNVALQDLDILVVVMPLSYRTLLPQDKLPRFVTHGGEHGK